MMLALIPVMFGGSELLLIGGCILLLFGGKKIPELMRSMGQGVRSFKEGMNDVVAEENLDEEIKENKSADESKEDKQ